MESEERTFCDGGVVDSPGGDLRSSLVKPIRAVISRVVNRAEKTKALWSISDRCQWVRRGTAFR